MDENFFDRLRTIAREAEPSIGDIGDAFEALVALDTDREGLRRMARERDVPLQGWLGSLVDRAWSADEFTAALMERKRVVNLTWRFMEAHDFFSRPPLAAQLLRWNAWGRQRRGWRSRRSVTSPGYPRHRYR